MGLAWAMNCQNHVNMSLHMKKWLKDSTLFLSNLFKLIYKSASHDLKNLTRGGRHRKKQALLLNSSP
jgi:hypothetical protein